MPSSQGGRRVESPPQGRTSAGTTERWIHAFFGRGQTTSAVTKTPSGGYEFRCYTKSSCDYVPKKSLGAARSGDVQLGTFNTFPVIGREAAIVAGATVLLVITVVCVTRAVARIRGRVAPPATNRHESSSVIALPSATADLSSAIAKAPATVDGSRTRYHQVMMPRTLTAVARFRDVILPATVGVRAQLDLGRELMFFTITTSGPGVSLVCSALVRQIFAHQGHPSAFGGAVGLGPLGRSPANVQRLRLGDNGGRPANTALFTVSSLLGPERQVGVGLVSAVVESMGSSGRFVINAGAAMSAMARGTPIDGRCQASHTGRRKSNNCNNNFDSMVYRQSGSPKVAWGVIRSSSANNGVKVHDLAHGQVALLCADVIFGTDVDEGGDINMVQSPDHNGVFGMGSPRPAISLYIRDMLRGTMISSTSAVVNAYTLCTSGSSTGTFVTPFPWSTSDAGDHGSYHGSSFGQMASLLCAGGVSEKGGRAAAAVETAEVLASGREELILTALRSPRFSISPYAINAVGAVMSLFMTTGDGVPFGPAPLLCAKQVIEKAGQASDDGAIIEVAHPRAPVSVYPVYRTMVQLYKRWHLGSGRYADTVFNQVSCGPVGETERGKSKHSFSAKIAATTAADDDSAKGAMPVDVEDNAFTILGALESPSSVVSTRSECFATPVSSPRTASRSKSPMSPTPRRSRSPIRRSPPASPPRTRGTATTIDPISPKAAVGVKEPEGPSTKEKMKRQNGTDREIATHARTDTNGKVFGDRTPPLATAVTTGAAARTSVTDPDARSAAIARLAKASKTPSNGTHDDAQVVEARLSQCLDRKYVGGEVNKGGGSSVVVKIRPRQQREPRMGGGMGALPMWQKQAGTEIEARAEVKTKVKVEERRNFNGKGFRRTGENRLCKDDARPAVSQHKFAVLHNAAAAAAARTGVVFKYRQQQTFVDAEDIAVAAPEAGSATSAMETTAVAAAAVPDHELTATECWSRMWGLYGVGASSSASPTGSVNTTDSSCHDEASPGIAPLPTGWSDSSAECEQLGEVKSKTSVVVIELGSGTVRAGVVGNGVGAGCERNESCFAEFPCYVAKPKVEGADPSEMVTAALVGADPVMYDKFRETGKFVGQHAWFCALDHPDRQLRSKLELYNAFGRGRIVPRDGWGLENDTALIVDHAFEELKQGSRVSPALVTYKPNSTEEEVAELVSIMLDQQEVSAVRPVNEAQLAALAAGVTNGVIVDIGDSGVYVSLIFDGFPVGEAVQFSKCGGGDVTRWMDHMLQSRTNEQYNQMADHRRLDFARQIKEAHCFVPLDFSEEVRRSGSFQRKTVQYFPEAELSPKLAAYRACTLSEFNHEREAEDVMAKSFTLKDGSELNVVFGLERAHACELLLQPELWRGSECEDEMGIADMVVEALAAMDAEDRQVMLGEVVVVGGSAALPGLAERIDKDLKERVPEHLRSLVKVRVCGGDDMLRKRPSAVALGAEMMMLRKEEHDTSNAAWVKCSDMDYDPDTTVGRQRFFI